MADNREKSRSYRDLNVWKLSIDLVKDVYRITQKFPASEIYALTSQIRRAMVSIPSNIAEGQGRSSSKEFRQFLGIAMGSMAELETQLIIATEIHYMTPLELIHFQSSIDTIRKMTKSLAKSLL